LSKLCTYLCSGLAPTAEIFRKAGWNVVTIDIDPKFNPTICEDVTLIDWGSFKREVLKDEGVDLLLASPDCRYFSIANPRWPRRGIRKAMEVVGSCFEAIAVLEPTWWLVENPRGRLRKLCPIPPNTTIFYSDYGGRFQSTCGGNTSGSSSVLETRRSSNGQNNGCKR
jgi:site-specific DNA-cytosine methylase